MGVIRGFCQRGVGRGLDRLERVLEPRVLVWGAELAVEARIIPWISELRAGIGGDTMKAAERYDAAANHRLAFRILELASSRRLYKKSGTYITVELNDKVDNEKTIHNHSLDLFPSLAMTASKLFTVLSLLNIFHAHSPSSLILFSSAHSSANAPRMDSFIRWMGMNFMSSRK